MSTIADGTCIRRLNLLLEFLAAWEKRPECLTRMICHWCSAISEAVGRLRPGETQIELPYYLGSPAGHNRYRQQDIGSCRTCSNFATTLFSAVGSDRDPGGSDATRSQVQHSLPQYLYECLLSIMLEVGFRRAVIGARFEGIDPNNTPHHKWIFETAFSSRDDEVVADAVRMWITTTGRTPLGSFARHFARRLGRYRPLSEGLRQLIIDVVERISDNEPWESGPETVRLLNCLNADMDNLSEFRQADLLWRVVVGPGGLELSSHYWRLLQRFLVDGETTFNLESCDWDVMRALREVEDWEKLEVWMLFIWRFLPRCGMPESIEDIRQVTLELLSQRPSALQKFENMYGEESNNGEEESNSTPEQVLQDICKQARAENPPSEDFPGLPYVSFQPAGTFLF